MSCSVGSWAAQYITWLLINFMSGSTVFPLSFLFFYSLLLLQASPVRKSPSEWVRELVVLFCRHLRSGKALRQPAWATIQMCIGPPQSMQAHGYSRWGSLPHMHASRLCKLVCHVHSMAQQKSSLPCVAADGHCVWACRSRGTTRLVSFFHLLCFLFSFPLSCFSEF